MQLTKGTGPMCEECLPGSFLLLPTLELGNEASLDVTQSHLTLILRPSPALQFLIACNAKVERKRLADLITCKDERVDRWEEVPDSRNLWLFQS